MIDFVLAIRLRQPRIGTRKLHYLLHEQADRALHLGRDHLFQVLRAQRLLVPRRRAYHKTTHSHHRFRRHPNLLKPGPAQVVASRPNQVWVADITYLPTRSGMSYVSLVTDAYSRKIVGHHVHESLRSEDVEQALRKALRQRPGHQPLIHHSDRGIQYCCDSYQKLHYQHGIQCSMTDGYDCYRRDLFFRLRIILIKVPRLYARGNDILLLARHFLAQHGKRYGKPGLRFSPEAETLLMSYSWPGNVRELRNMLEQTVLLTPGNTIGPNQLTLCLSLIDEAPGMPLTPATTVEPENTLGDNLSLPEMERDMVIRTLDRTDWNVTKSARLLGLSRDMLRYRIEKLGLVRPERQE